MVAGEGSRLSLFQMGLPIEEDAFLQQVKFDQFPISSATFSMDGSRLIAGSRSHPFLYSYDLIAGQSTQIPLPKVIVKQNMGRFILSPNTDASYMAMLGKYGEIHLMNANSMEYLKALKMPGRVTCATFSPSDNTKLYTFGDQGKVFIWDLRQQALWHSFFDDGAVRGASMAISKDGAYLACGANTGIVNVYEGDVVHKTDTPRPIKVVNNLTTSVDHMAFSPDSQMLAISSKVRNCAVRLVHLASRTIFANFPSRNDKICHSTAIDFSPNGGYMAMGNDRGHTLLYRLYHYPDY